MLDHAFAERILHDYKVRRDATRVTDDRGSVQLFEMNLKAADAHTNGWILSLFFLSSQDIFKQATEDRLTSANELPYFEGDFWPNVLEESIKELEQEEEERKKEENTAASETPEVRFARYKHVGFGPYQQGRRH